MLSCHCHRQLCHQMWEKERGKTWGVNSQTGTLYSLQTIMWHCRANAFSLWLRETSLCPITMVCHRQMLAEVITSHSVGCDSCNAQLLCWDTILWDAPQHLSSRNHGVHPWMYNLVLMVLWKHFKLWHHRASQHPYKGIVPITIFHSIKYYRIL